jgi:nonribosomal peptide synthetase DhbF
MPDQSIGRIGLLASDERSEMLQQWNRTDHAIPEKTVASLFEEQTAQAPDMVAVVFQDEHVTFQSLNRRANQIARYLQTRGVKPETRVGIAIDRSAEMLIALLGILKAGAAYVPLDRNHPVERLRFMAQDAGAQIIVTGDTLEWSSNIPVVALDACQHDIGGQDGRNLGPNVGPDSLIYVMYTSGSTGTPKGVAVTHRNVVNLLCWMQRRFRLQNDDRILQKTAATFDVSVWELLWLTVQPLTVVMAPPGAHRDFDQLYRCIAMEQVTTAHFVPSLLKAFLEHVPQPASSSLRRVLSGGESLSPDLHAAAQRKLSAVVHHLYGPTETTVDASCWYNEGAEKLQTIPIGSPIWNTQLYVLDRNLDPQPIAVVGELYIAGTGVARGYWSRAAATADRFVANCFGNHGSRMYRTGDLAKWRSNGSLEFVGRVDSQTKLRGYRIELAEIEAALLRCMGVMQAVAVVRKSESGEQQLVAYVTVAADAALTSAQLLSALQGVLPDYMVPSAIKIVDSFPLTLHGKVDRAALSSLRLSVRTTSRQPRTPDEKVLCGLFAEVLKVEDVGIDDNFFELGGHSLMATRLVSRIRRVLEVEVPVRTLFERPTVAELAKVVREGERGRPELTRMERPQRLPLSFAQQRLWFIDRLEEGRSREYNVPGVLRLKGELDHGALRRALETIIERHESLRTRFEEVEGEPVQVIEEGVKMELPLEDLSAMEEGERERRMREVMREEREKTFDLSRWPLVSVRLLKLREREHILLRTMHHIVSDRWSQAVFNRELTTLYLAYREGLQNPLKPLEVQYADYALWQKKWLGETGLADGLAYWKKQLDGIPARLELLTDHPRPAVQTFAADVCHLMLTPDQAAGLRRLCQQANATLYMTMLAAFGVLMWRYSGQDDIVVGSPIAHRQDAKLEDLIGFFVNTLVIRMKLEPRASFRRLLDHVRATTLDAYRYQDVPFERLVEQVGPSRSLDGTTFYQIVFSVQNVPRSMPALANLEIGAIASPVPTVRVDLEVHVMERAGGIAVYWMYKPSLFERAKIEAMVRQYQKIIDLIIHDAEVPVWRIDSLNPEERWQLLHGRNLTSRTLPAQTICEMVETQVRENPERIAVVCEDDRFSYAFMNARANQLARYLRSRGIGPEQVVAIALERSFELIVTMVGVLKAGAAYLSVDPDHPAERRNRILGEARPSCVLTLAAVRQRMVLKLDQCCVALDDLETAQAIAGMPEHDLSDSERTAALAGTHPAYIVYTSGSTGQPKGIVVPHYGVVNYLAWLRSEGPPSMVPVPTTLSTAFDGSVPQLLGPLAAGSYVWLLPYDVVREPARLLTSIRQSGRAGLTLVPTLWRPFLELDTAVQDQMKYHLDHVSLGGESLTSELIEKTLRIAPELKIWNLYGPSETTVIATTGRPVSARDADVIGKPISNTSVYVLDKQLEPVPIGVAGELYIGGVGLARGYVKRAALTAERFVPDPHGSSGTRMYRTGDMAQWRYDGSIKFLGRTDEQVKIRGIRVELGEVEAVLAQYPGVAGVHAVAQEIAGQNEIIAYVIAVDGFELNSVALRRYASGPLPAYMVPRDVVILDRWPLMPNGKLDRNALPQPEFILKQYRAPTNAEESMLCELFAEVLALPQVGVDDNFFELGGHSLSILRLIGRIRQTLGVEMLVKTVFESPTVAELAERLNLRQTSHTAFDRVLHIRKGGDSLPPLFCLPLPIGLGWMHASMLPGLNPRRPVYCLQAAELSTTGPLPATMAEWAKDYTRLITSIDPRGPYCLLGLSLSGLLAYAVACCLQQAGLEVRGLAMVDAYPARAGDARAHDPERTNEMHRQFIQKVGKFFYGADAARAMEFLENGVRLARSYSPGAFIGDPLLVAATARRPAHPDLWKPHVIGNVILNEVNCTHAQLLTATNLVGVAQAIESYLMR